MGSNVHDLLSLHDQPVMPYTSKKEQVVAGVLEQSAPSLFFPLESHVLSHPAVPSWSKEIRVVGSNVHDFPSLHYQPVMPYTSKKSQVVAGGTSAQSAPSLSFPSGSHVLSHPSTPS